MADYQSVSALSPGDVVVVGDIPRVAHRAIGNGEFGALAASGGVYEATGDAAIAAGKKVFWDATSGKMTETINANKPFGFSISSCSGDGGTFLVRHSPDGADVRIANSYSPIKKYGLKWRQVTSRCISSDNYDTGYKQSMLKRFFPVYSDVTSLQFVFTSWAIQGGNPNFGPPTPSTFEASLEYAGVRYRITFNGSNQGVETVGSFLYSDVLPINIPAGGSFILRVWQSNATGLTWAGAGGGGGTKGDGMSIGVTTTPNVVMSGDVGFGNGSIAGCPVAILAQSYTPALLMIGDSIGRGQGDGAGNALGACGILDRSAVKSLPYINLCASGSRLENWGNVTNFISSGMFGGLVQYADIAIVQPGSNDCFIGGKTDAQMRTSLTAISRLLLLVYQRSKYMPAQSFHGLLHRIVGQP